MLSNANGDLQQASLPSETTAQLRRQLDALTAELERSLSPALAGELHRIIDRKKDTAAHGGRAARRVREPAGLDDRPGDRDTHPDRAGQREDPPDGLARSPRRASDGHGRLKTAGLRSTCR